MIDVALTTDGSALDLTPDDRILREALEARGLSVSVLPWSLESYDWSTVRLVMPRGLPQRPSPETARAMDDWLGRAQELSSPVNPIRLTRWAAHARSFGDLASAGIHVASTACFEQGASVDLSEECSSRGAASVVAGPALRHGGERRRFGLDEMEEAQVDLDSRLQASEVSLTFDPPLGERGRVRSLVYVEGGFSHAVSAIPGEPSSLDAVLPREDEIALARSVLEAAPGEAIYARLDIARDHEDRPCLVEFDVQDGPLHFEWGEDSAHRLAGSLFARLARE